MTWSQRLSDSIAIVPAGRWGVAVSGGADSVALLRLMLLRPDVTCHVVHLDHETRNGESTADAQFVKELCQASGVSASFATRSAMEREWQTELAGELSRQVNKTGLAPTDVVRPTTPPSSWSERRPLSQNRSARFRDLRLKFYRSVVEDQQLQGVLTGHHADDVAETVLLRLLRGGGYSGLTGIAPKTFVSNVTILRPLLRVCRDDLRLFLLAIGQPWREDESNASDDYGRNRIRKVLADRPDFTSALLSAGYTCGSLMRWVEERTPVPEPRLEVKKVALLPDVLSDALVADWLVRRGVSAEGLSGRHVSAIVRMCRDMGSAARHAAPGGWSIRRRGGWVWAERG